MRTGLGRPFRTQYRKCQWENTPYKDRIYELALFEKTGNIARITFNRPESYNAVNDALLEDFLAGLHQANDDDDVKVVIVKGRGKCFSVGHDLKLTDTDETTAISPDLNPCLADYYGFERRRCSKHEDIFHFPKPIIAQVHSYCIGAGEYIASACDIIIAAKDAQFGARGLGSFLTGVQNWPGVWPVWSQKTLSGHVSPELTGEEAHAVGLINKAVPSEELENETEKCAEAIATAPLEATMLVKSWLSGIMDITGIGAGWRAHYGGHVSLQYVRFREDEINFYRVMKEGGFKKYKKKRYVAASSSENREFVKNDENKNADNPV